MLWLRLRRAGGGFAKLRQTRPKILAPLSIFGRPEAQTDIWCWCEPIPKSLSSASTQECDFE